MHILPPNVINFKKIILRFINFFLQNKRVILSLLFILLYISLYFLIDFSTQSLIAHDEGLYARRARLIEYSDNWFSPPFSSPHHKTLGSYWLTALAIRLFGNSELSLRLPSILSSFLSLISSYLIALKITNKKSALISVFSLSSMPLWIQYSRYTSPDIPFVLCILLVILFFLHSLDSAQNFKQYFYILLSGLFISISFFIRSYMAFVPLLGLSPFIFYHLFRKESIFRISFIAGILFGAIPTFLNLYFSFQKFGIIGITTLFDFARKQAIGDSGFNNILFIPLNFLYLTFPIGMLFLALFAFTRSNNKMHYPLLIFCYPLLSLIILLFMSTSYPHYYLFLLPPLSILFSLYLTSSTFKFSFSKTSIKYFLSIIIIFISFIILFFIINYHDLIKQNFHGNSFLLYITITFLFLSYSSSIRYLFDNKYFQFNLTNFFYSIVFSQYISLSLLFNLGLLGNPNYNTKLFIKDKVVSSIIKSNTIYLLRVDSKIQTLLSYYLPFSKVINNFDGISKYKYLITSDSFSLEISDSKQVFKPIKKFDNHILLMNTGE